MNDGEFSLFLSKKRQQSYHPKFLFGIYSIYYEEICVWLSEEIEGKDIECCMTLSL